MSYRVQNGQACLIYHHVPEATEQSVLREYWKWKRKQPNNFTMTMWTFVHSKRAGNLNRKEAKFVTMLLALLPCLVLPLPLSTSFFNTHFYSQCFYSLRFGHHYFPGIQRHAFSSEKIFSFLLPFRFAVHSLKQSKEPGTVLRPPFECSVSFVFCRNGPC